MQTIDLLILGAGPAGLSTALHLLQQDPAWGSRMLLLEKAAHPRHKLCGGAVTRLGFNILQALGFSLPLPIPQARVDDVRFAYGARTVHVRGRPQLVIFYRAEFDAFLADQARQRGAVIRENEKVESLEVDEAGVSVTTNKDTYRALVVVGADGAKGITRRRFNQRNETSRVARLLEVITPAQENAPHFKERYALFDFTPASSGLQGYFWDFPARVNGQPFFNRGVYDARLDQTRPRARLPMLLQQSLSAVKEDPANTRPEGHPIHWFSPRNQFSQPRLLLVGDAAGADPLFGEGIGPALEYGQVAAETIRQAFARNNFSLRDYRGRVFRSNVGRYLLVRWWIAWWSYRLSGQAWYMRLFWAICALIAHLWPEPRPLEETPVKTAPPAG